CAPASLAQAPVDLATLDEGMYGSPSQVLVLGTLHLDEIDGFDPAVLDPLLDRLASFNPAIITIEALSGEECDLYARHPTVYPGGVDWCPVPVEARTATGLDVASALGAVRATLADWPADPAPGQRRRLAGDAHHPAPAALAPLLPHRCRRLLADPAGRRAAHD